MKGGARVYISTHTMFKLLVAEAGARTLGRRCRMHRLRACWRIGRIGPLGGCYIQQWAAARYAATPAAA